MSCRFFKRGVCVNNQSISQRSLAHPPGLWFIAFSAALMCIGFGAINSQLVLYTHSVLHFKSAKFYLLSSTYNSLLFTLPLVGGYLAEKLGYRRAMLFGTGLCTLGLILISIPKISTMYYGLSAFTVGTCLFVPSYLVLQGKLYSKTDPRRESAFTLSYIIMNLGFLISGIFGGYVAEYLGYTAMYLIAAGLMLSVYVLYFFGYKTIVPFNERNIEPQLKWSRPIIWVTMCVASLILLFFALWLLENPSDTTLLLSIIIGGATLGVIITAIRFKDSVARHRLIAFLILSYFTIGFWALYALEPSLLTVFIRDNVNRQFANSSIPAGVFYSLDAIFVIIIGAFFGWLWRYLESKNRDPSLPTKFTLSLIIMGLGILVLPFAMHLAGMDHKISMYWIVVMYALLAAAELLISPIGQAMVGRLSPEGMEGVLMGTWQLFTGFAGAVSVYLDNLAHLPQEKSLAVTNPLYSIAFLKIGGITIGLGIVSLCFIPYIKRLISK